MIGLQELIINHDIKITQLAEELGIKPDNIWYWIKNNKVPEKRLNMLAEKFNVEKDYLNKKVNDINTYRPKGRKNEYKIVDDGVIIYLERRNKEPVETIIDLKHFERVKKSGFRWIPTWNDVMKKYYAREQNL